MRIKKVAERWFPCVDDPDEGSVKIKHLSPGEVQDIYDETMPQNIKYEPDGEGNMIPVFNTEMNRKDQREKTMTAAIVDWKNHFDEGGNLLECTPENIIRASREIEGYSQFIDGCRNILGKDIEKEKEMQEKNLPISVSES